MDKHHGESVFSAYIGKCCVSQWSARLSLGWGWRKSCSLLNYTPMCIFQTFASFLIPYFSLKMNEAWSSKQYKPSGAHKIILNIKLFKLCTKSTENKASQSFGNLTHSCWYQLCRKIAFPALKVMKCYNPCNRVAWPSLACVRFKTSVTEELHQLERNPKVLISIWAGSPGQRERKRTSP